MFFRLMLLFTVVPLIELSLLIKLGSSIGSGATIGIVILTGVLGAFLAKQEGFLVISKIRQELNEARLPANHLLDGVIILVGGLLLITPGLLTDTIGFLALIPVTRQYFKEFLKRKFNQKINSGQIYTSYTVDD